MEHSYNSTSRSRILTLFSFRNFRILLIVLTGCAIFLSAVQAVRFLPVTSENVYPESSGALSVLRWSHGQSLYEDFRKPPYLTTPFPPLWYGIMRLTTQFGVSNLDSVTQVGRIFSLICLLGIAALSYFWNRRLGFSRSLSILAPAFFLSMPILVPWAVTARPDLLGLLLSVLAIYLMANSSNSALVAASGVVAALAFLARHNSVAAPVAAVIWLAATRRWKHAFMFCAIWAMIVGPVLIAFQKTSGGFLFLNLAGGKFGQVSPSYARDVLARFLEPAGGAFVIALFAFGLFAFIEAWRGGESRSRLLCLYTVVALMLAIVGSATAGSAPNHYLETALALALLIPVGLLSLERSLSNDSPLAAVATILVVLFLLPSLDVQRSNVVHNRPDDLRSLTPLVAERHVFSDIPYVAARAANPEALDLASLINSERSKSGNGWTSAAVVHDLDEKKFALVILSQPVEEAYVPNGLYPRYPRLDEAIRDAIRQNYGLCSHSAVAYIYSPAYSDFNSSSCHVNLEQSTRAAAGVQ